jgi:hypothetical protein
MKKSTSSAESAILGIASLNPITAAIAALYSVGSSINDFFNEHIENLKLSENHVIASTGRVLEGAKFGFGLGYLSSVAIVAVGQLILGNNLIVGAFSAVGTVTSAAVLANPVAMTCGAIGAICYGWAALTDQEKDVILNRIQTGLEIGVELTKSLISFVTRKMSEFLDSKQYAALKEFVKTQAAQFGKSLFDVTKAASDLVKGLLRNLGDIAERTATSTVEVAKEASDGISQAAKTVSDIAGQAADSTVSATKKAADAATQATGSVSNAASEMAKAIGETIKGSSN